MSFSALIVRDVRLATRAGGSAALALAFFAMTATLTPLAVGADLRLLTRIAGGVLWVAAVLAALLSLDRLFQADFEDGSLDAAAPAFAHRRAQPDFVLARSASISATKRSKR